MATVKKSQKYQTGGIVSTVKKAAAKVADKVSTAVKNAAPKTGSNPYKKVADLSKTRGQRFLSKDKEEMKYGGKMKKAENGKSFPDLNKDGKVTKADILKGRGVIAKSGMKMAKKPVMKFGGTLSPNKSNVSKYVSNLNKAKSGAKMKRGC